MSVYRKSLHQFFLRVHPDFFARSNPEWQRCNEQSIAQLNELLDWARAFKAGEQKPPPATQISFRFFRRPDDDAASISSSSAATSDRGGGQQQPPAIALPAQLSAHFDLPKGFSAQTSSAPAQVERSVNRFLRDLLRKAGCLDSVASAASSAQDDRLAAEELQASVGQRRTGVAGILERDAVQDGVAAAAKLKRRPAVETLLDAASDTVSEARQRGGSFAAGRFATPEDTPTVEELVEADQVLFSRLLSPLQCASATQRLGRLLPQMRYEEWQFVPIVFTHLPDSYQAGRDVLGTITIPWDFELAPFLEFLNNDGVKIRDAREHLEQTAQRIELLVSDLCQRMSLDDVLITCSHREALPFMELLLDNAEQLNMLGLSDVTLEISDHFAHRDNGVVVFDKKANAQQLIKAMDKNFRHLMPELRLRYDTAKKLLSEIQQYKERFLEDVRAADADCETSSQPYAQRLAWIKELGKIGPQLAQFDWGDITFALGPLSLDWEGKVLSLPADFDGAAFVKYIEELQRERKQEEEDRNAEYEALRKHSDTMQSSLVGQSTMDVAGSPRIAEGKSSRKQDSSSSPLADGGSGGGGFDQDSKKHMHPSAPSWRNEYLVASADSAERGGPRMWDPHQRADENRELWTERPLHHDMRGIQNEQDATEQLEWEGFYNEPYVPQRPQREDEEMQTAYMQTNRKHRQEAVEKMVRDLDEKYGLSTSRFRKMTLGDRAGINDPRKTAMQYPGVSKGTYAGDDNTAPLVTKD